MTQYRRSRNLYEIIDESERKIRDLRRTLARTSLRGHTHTEADITDLGSYALSSHNHSGVYSLTSHNHSGVYALDSHTHSYLPLSGGTMTGPIYAGTVETLISMNRSGNNIISKSGSGNLYIDNSVTSGQILLRADDSGGTIRNRFVINGNGVVTTYAKDGSSRFVVKAPTDNGATTVREGGAIVAEGGQLGTTAGNIARAASFRLNNGNNQTLEIQAVRESSSSGWASARLGFRLLTDATDHGSMWFTNNQIVMHSTSLYGSAKLQVAGGFNMIPASSAGSPVYMVSVGGSRYALTSVSSVLRSKTVEDDSPDLADIDLRPVRFKTKEGGEILYGFVADWLAEQDPLFGVYDHEGTLENFHDRAVIAALAAKVNRLEERLEIG